MKKLSGKQVSFLRGRAHHLNPVVMTGQNGVTEAVLKAIEGTLDHHELIKIRIRCSDQSELLDLLRRITENVRAALVQVIGHTAVLYRPSAQRKIKLPA